MVHTEFSVHLRRVEAGMLTASISAPNAGDSTQQVPEDPVDTPKNAWMDASKHRSLGKYFSAIMNS
jgi:hypothetical protein